MIDLHCHILPGVDDGSASLGESISMARTAAEDGIETIVAAAHTLNGVYVNPIEDVVSKVRGLQAVLKRNLIEINLCPSCEVHLCPHMLERVKSGDAGTINNAGKYLLLELPSQTVPKRVMDEIFLLKLNGITPIITHPERNPSMQKDLDMLYKFVRMGALSQVTAFSVTGDFGEAARQSVETMLKHRLCHIIASDGHSAESRPPVLRRALEEAAGILGSYREAERMVTEVPGAILSGKEPEIPEAMRPGKRPPLYKRLASRFLKTQG